MHHYPPAIRRICLVVFCLTLALTLGQGLLRYRHVLGFTGQQFIQLNEADALLHATLAQRLIDGKGYTLPTTKIDGPIGDSQPAFEKAPAYPFLLSLLFRVTGFGFSFFPFQCLASALLSVLVVLVSFETFSDPLAALFAGVAASVHPVLVNAASQLYNENLYFFLFFLVVWLYLRLHRAPSLGLALLCGCVAGVTALVRESMLVSCAALALWFFISGWRSNGLAALKTAAAIVAGLVIVVIPWTIRNYVVTGGKLVPISTISLALLGAGNNDCVSAESWDTAFYGDNICLSLNEQNVALLAKEHKVSQTLTRMSATAAIGEHWIFSHPGMYLKLCVRRAWTLFDPWHPQQHLMGVKKLVMLLYFVIFVFSGVVGAVWVAMRRAVSFQVMTLYLLILAMYAPLVALFISHDHRFGIGIHLLLACFGGAWLAHFSFAKAILKWKEE